MYFDKRMIYIVIAIMIITGLQSYLTDTSKLLGLLLTIPGVLIAITFHEFAHAFAADKLGDETPRAQGRLTLNPLAHFDPFGTIMLLFAGFGWGRPVQVNPRNYTRTMSMEKADAIVSIAGPAMNFILAILFTIIYCAIYKFAPISFAMSQIGSIITMIILYTISINIGLGIFNLIPLPPLDGSKVIKPILPYNAKTWFEQNEKIFELIFIALWAFGVLGTMISPVIGVVYEGILKLGVNIFGL